MTRMHKEKHFDSIYTAPGRDGVILPVSAWLDERTEFSRLAAADSRKGEFMAPRKLGIQDSKSFVTLEKKS